MKKILFLTLIASALLFSASCERKGAIYEMPEGAQLLSFASDVASFKMLAADGNKITVFLNRGNTKGALSVPFTFTDGTDGVFTPAKSSFDFADGEATAYLDITYPDINAFGSEEYTMSIAVDETQVSPAGIGELEIKAVRKLTPVLLGTGKFESLVFFEDEWDQEIYNLEEIPNHYILPDCFVNGTDVVFDMIDGKPVFAQAFFSGYLVSGFQLWFAPKSVELKDGKITIVTPFYLPEYNNYDWGGMLETQIFTLPEGVTLQ